MTRCLVMPALLASVVLAAGCPEKGKHAADAPETKAAEQAWRPPPNAPAAAAERSAAPSNSDAVAGRADPAPVAAARIPSIPRKIIYTAELGLIVTELASLENELPRLIKQYGGYVLNSKVDVNQGRRRSGTWAVKVPVERFHDTLNALAKLGSQEKRNIDSQDVTEDFVDIEARVANKKGLEQRVLALLEKRSGDINEVLRLEAELSRIREEIERMQGRLKYLAGMSSLSTITIIRASRTPTSRRPRRRRNWPSRSARCGTARWRCWRRSGSSCS